MTDASPLSELRSELVLWGADLVAVADLASVPREDRQGFPRAVSLGLALAPGIIGWIERYLKRAGEAD